MKRTGNSKIAVVGWGRGMGHQGHMYLADAVITQAINMKADPYFFVSKTIGKDDPVFPEEKVRIYQKVFPQYANIFEPQGNLNGALTHLADLGYQGVVVVVGADQKKAFQYLEGPNKEGVPVYQTMGLKKLKVISRQETNSKFAHEEGPRATPMREILLDPNASEEDKFKVWRRDMPEQLGDREVLDIMNKAESRLVHSNKPKVDKVQAMSKKAAKLKEAIMSFKVKKPTEQQPEKEPTLGYKHLFKQPGEEPKPIEKHYRGWEEYEKEHNPDEVEESRIIDANAKVNLYYVTPKGARQKVFQAIPHRMIDKAIMVLRSKYPKIKDTDIEMRPAGYGEYTRTEDVAEGSDPYTDGYNAWKEYLSGKTNRYPKNPYPAGNGMSQWEAGAAKAAEGRDFISGSDQGVEEASGVTRRGILKGIAGAGALGAAGKASGIAGAFPTPSHQAAMYKAAADSNAAQARADAAEKAKRDAQRLKQGTSDIERLNKINFHGGKVTPINATWDGDSDFMDVDGTKYSMASRMPIKGDEPGNMKLVSTKEGRLVYMWTRNSLKGVVGRYFYPAPAGTSQINEFAPDEGGGSRKFIPWTEFIEQLKQILNKDFNCVENIVKSTIKARFVPHDPMEFGPTMLYSYYETRAGGRNKGAISTRGSIQVGKYFTGGLFGKEEKRLLTSFNLLKGHPFERHFDLTFDNIYKIANIIQGNTQGALEFKPEQVNEFAPDDSGDNGQEDMFFKYAKLWYNGNLQVQQRVEEILAQAGWEIGPLESEEGGAFIVQSGDENGDTYMGWSAQELEGLTESALQGKEDLDAKRKALQDMEREPGHDKEAIRQRKLDLEKEARSKGLSEDYIDEK